MIQSYYMTGAEIKDAFKCEQSTYMKTRKIIRDHPERYTHYAIVDRLTSALAFADAKAFGKQLSAGQAVPPFEPDKAAMMMGVLRNAE